MWWPSTDAWHLYVAGDAVAARRVHGLPWQRRVEARPVEACAGLHDLGRALDAALASARRGSALTALLGSAHVRFAVLPKVEGVQSEGERTAVAAAYLKEQLGLQPTEWWTITVEPAPGNVVAAAVRRTVADVLRAQAAKRRLRLTGVRPFATGVWDASGQAGADSTQALLVEEADALASFVSDGIRLHTANAVLSDRTSHAAERERERIAMAFGMASDTVQVLRVAAAAAPPHAPGALRADFLDLITRVPA